MLATAVTPVKAGDNELTLSNGIKHLSNVNVVMKLRCGCQQLVTAVKAGNSLKQLSKPATACNSCQYWRQLVIACNSCQSQQQLVTAVNAGNSCNNELTLSNGIKYLSNVNVVMKLKCICQQLATAVKAGNSF